MDTEQKQMIDKIRAAIKDRATWFALLYRSFKETMPDDQAEKLARRAIFEFGKMKAAKDPNNFTPELWVRRHVEKGSHLVFDSDIQTGPEPAVQQMKYCALVEAWKEMGCTPEEIELFCDIAMEGDRGRAHANGVRMELTGTLARGDSCCTLKIYSS